MQETVTEVSLTPTIKTVTTDTHTYEAPHIILACGTTPRRLGIPGELELQERVYAKMPQRMLPFAPVNMFMS